MSENLPQNNATPTAAQKICILPLPKVPNLPAITKVNELIANESNAPDELVAGLVHLGTKCVLASNSKAGKTWILLFLALCVATGLKFLRWITKQHRVLYINFEIQSVFMKSRLEVLMKHMGITSAENLDVWNLRGYTGDFDALMAEIARAIAGKGYALIILDPIYKLMVGKSENGSTGVGVLCNRLEQLVEQSGAAVVYAHHFAKGDASKKSTIDRMSGSGVFARDADTIITLTEHTEENCYTLETILRNFPKQDPFVVEWKFPVLEVRDDLDPEDITPEDAPTDSDEGLVQLLRERPLTTGEWQKAALELGKSRATFYRIKDVLKQKGFVEFDSKTKTWRIPEGKAKSQMSHESQGDTGETDETKKASDGSEGEAETA